jgi:hypothetical protein
MTWYELWLPADAFQVRGAGSCELRRHAGVNSQQSLSAAAIISRILTRWDFDAVLSVCWSSLLRALGPPCVLLMKILTAGRPELCIPEAQVVKSQPPRPPRLRRWKPQLPLDPVCNRPLVSNCAGLAPVASVRQCAAVAPLSNERRASVSATAAVAAHRGCLCQQKATATVPLVTPAF